MRSGRSKPAQKVRDRSALGTLRFDCDVLPARVERLKGARFRLTVFPSLPLPRSGDHHADVTTLMARGAGRINPHYGVTRRSSTTTGSTTRSAFVIDLSPEDKTYCKILVI